MFVFICLPGTTARKADVLSHCSELSGVNSYRGLEFVRAHVRSGAYDAERVFLRSVSCEATVWWYSASFLFMR